MRTFENYSLLRWAQSMLVVVALAMGAHAQEKPVVFEDYFTNAALRLELYEIGNAQEEIITEHGIYMEPVWPENPRSLIQPFEVGRYCLKVYDKESNRLIYSRGFNPMFAEYKTTQPAIDGVKRAYEAALRFPCPLKPVKVVVERRDKFYVPAPLYTTAVDPNDYHIIRENVNMGDTVFELQKTGDPHDKVDFVFLAEGYTAADKDKFKADAERMTDFLFKSEPYKSNKEKFNVNAIFRASPEKGMDEPRQRRYKSTVLNASYNSFDLDRYLLVQDSFAMHRMAAQVPYDTIIVLVNSARYGGGSICLDYCITTVDNNTSPKIFIHELGHSFAFLADEYTGDVAYNDFYPKGVEPLDPNITELLDKSNIKWKALLTPGVPIPTPATWGREEVEAQQNNLKVAEKERTAQSEAAKAKGQSEAEIAALDKDWKSREQEIRAKLDAARAKPDNVVGAFEGAGYMTTGMYRAQRKCIMGTGGDQFCAVCKQALQRMIDYYAADGVKP